MEIALTANAFREGEGPDAFRFDEIVALAHRAGFHVLDWSAHEGVLFRDGHCLDRDACRRWAEAQRRHADQCGVRFEQMHCPALYLSDSPERRRYVETALHHFMDAAALLGIHTMVMHPVTPDVGAREFEQALEINRRYFRDWAEHAAQQELSIAVENMIMKRSLEGGVDFRACTSIDELIALVDAVDCENVGFCYDVGHAHYMNSSADSDIPRLGARLWAVHVHDNDGFSDQHLMPFQGSVDFNAFSRALARVDFRGALTLEPMGASRNLPKALMLPMIKTMNLTATYIARCVDREKAQEGNRHGLDNGRFSAEQETDSGGTSWLFGVLSGEHADCV